MSDKYNFKQKTCPCGLDLTDKKAAVAGYWEGLTPEGECPECGRSLILDAPALKHPLDEPATPPPAEPEPEPEPAPETAKPEAEPVAEPEPEKEPE